MIGSRLRRYTRLLLRIQPSPVVELNRAVAVALGDGLPEGLHLLDELELRGELAGYHLLPAAQGDLLRRMGRWAQAAEAYRRALSLVSSEAERRLGEMEGQISDPPRN